VNRTLRKGDVTQINDLNRFYVQVIQFYQFDRINHAVSSSRIILSQLCRNALYANADFVRTPVVLVHFWQLGPVPPFSLVSLSQAYLSVLADGRHFFFLFEQFSLNSGLHVYIL